MHFSSKKSAIRPVKKKFVCVYVDFGQIVSFIFLITKIPKFFGSDRSCDFEYMFALILS